MIAMVIVITNYLESYHRLFDHNRNLKGGREISKSKGVREWR
jgi:hypothetical protein